ncbi:hypothetical protein FANTH_6786 [Fusarium anthophilum]|uniref:Uncharacterized protein n=1 Tax=Fusarium anthophilum TaxID=48485 RepID=A0A8H4ZH88_9HYPO|nr:hypothetical protein FANTH_6786 [Fusarium anthophilum]
MKSIITPVSSVAFLPSAFAATVHTANTDDLKGATNTFNAALRESQYNLTVTDGEIGDFSTSLFGFEGCGDWGSPKRKAIYSGWQQAWHMMDAVQTKGLNWNEAAAIEFFAPPFINEEEQSSIKSTVSQRLYSVYTQLAYTTNKDQESGKARIAFCPNYFLEPDLLKVIDENSKKELPIEHRADLNNYVRNKGRVWFHELLHIDWASGVDPQYHIVDLYALYTRRDHTVAKQKIYNPAKTKGLAAFHLNPAWWIKRSADNFAMYAMAKTVQKITGNYPHLPFASTLECVYDGQGKCQDSEFKHGPGDKNLVIPLSSTPQWIAIQDTNEEPIKDFCLAKVLAKVPAKGDEGNPEFPTELPAFEAHEAKGCDLV